MSVYKCVKVYPMWTHWPPVTHLCFVCCPEETSANWLTDTFLPNRRREILTTARDVPRCYRGHGLGLLIPIIPWMVQFVCWLLKVPATYWCISGTDLLRQFYVLPH